MAAPQTKSFQFKLVLLGDSAVGKSSLVLRFVKKQFYEYQESTIGAAFLTQTVQLPDCIVKFEIWDTAGQQSFVRAKTWVKELQRQGQQNIVIALAGNKLDLADQRQVDIEEAKAYADDNNIFLLETSAKSNHNVTEVFKQIAIKLPKNTVQPKTQGVVVDPEQIVVPTTEKKCCG